MKTFLPIVTAGSLTLTLLLVGLLFAGRSSEPPDEAATTANTAAASASPTSLPPPGKSDLDAQVWTGLVSSALPQMVQQFRDAGFPAHIVRAILAAQIRDSFAARRKAVDPEAETRPYWNCLLYTSPSPRD